MMEINKGYYTFRVIKKYWLPTQKPELTSTLSTITE